MVTLEEAKAVAYHLKETVSPVSVIALGSVAAQGGTATTWTCSW